MVNTLFAIEYDGDVLFVIISACHYEYEGNEEEHTKKEVPADAEIHFLFSL